jgi:hypothetical protein
MEKECMQGFGRNTIEKETTGIPKQSWKGNIKMVLEK